MKHFLKYIPYLFVISIGFIPFIPDLGSIDLKAPQYLYLTITQILVTIYLLITNKDSKIELNFLDFFYILFLIISLISFVSSENLQESIIEWGQYFILFNTYFNLKLLFKEVKGKDLLFAIIITLLFVESFYTVLIFLKNYSFESGLERIRELQGFSSNQNIGAFSILIKIPILLYLLNFLKNKYLKIGLVLILISSIFFILVIASRGAMIGIIIILLMLLVSRIIFKENPIIKNKTIYLYLGVLIGSFLLQNILYFNNSDLASGNRITNFNDNSTKERISYFKSAIKLYIENPITGVGIGNWKITSIKELNSEINEYTVPYHTHNDFLQIASETGTFGILSYLLIFLTPIYFIFKKIYFNKDDVSDFELFLMFSILIFIWDSLINFPRLRPYSQVTILYVISYISSLNFVPFVKKLVFKKFSILVLFIFLLLPSFYLHARVFKSYKQIFYLYYDFNLNSFDLEANSDDIKDYEDMLPNITNTTIPIKHSKANYYYQEKKYEKAKSLIFEGEKFNPYLGFGDLLLSKIYYETNKKDSALYYIKKAYSKIPKNAAHVALYQTLLGENNEFIEEEKVFEETKQMKNELLWSNHFFILLKDSLKRINKNYSEKDKIYINEALKYFPKNPFFKSFDFLINKGLDSAVIVSKIDLLANNYYNQNNFKKAIEYWQKAVEFVPKEDSYLLNIALSYCQLDDYYQAIETLKIIESKKIKSDDGQFEFISGYALNGLGKRDLACKYIRESKKKGYAAADSFLKNIRCKF